MAPKEKLNSKLFIAGADGPTAFYIPYVPDAEELGVLIQKCGGIIAERWSPGVVTIMDVGSGIRPPVPGDIVASNWVKHSARVGKPKPMADYVVPEPSIISHILAHCALPTLDLSVKDPFGVRPTEDDCVDPSLGVADVIAPAGGSGTRGGSSLPAVGVPSYSSENSEETLAAYIKDPFLPHRNPRDPSLAWAHLSQKTVDELRGLAGSTDARLKLLAYLVQLSDYKSNPQSSLVMDVYLSHLVWAFSKGFTSPQVSAAFTILKQVTDMVMGTPHDGVVSSSAKNPAEVLEVLGGLLLQHSLAPSVEIPTTVEPSPPPAAPVPASTSTNTRGGRRGLQGQSQNPAPETTPIVEASPPKTCALFSSADATSLLTYFKDSVLCHWALHRAVMSLPAATADFGSTLILEAPCKRPVALGGALTAQEWADKLSREEREREKKRLSELEEARRRAREEELKKKEEEEFERRRAMFADGSTSPEQLAELTAQLVAQRVAEAREEMAAEMAEREEMLASRVSALEVELGGTVGSSRADRAKSTKGRNGTTSRPRSGRKARGGE